MDYITFCHNDFSPRNIFVGKNIVDIIDYVGVEKVFPEDDINFFSNYILNARFNMLYSLRLKKEMVAVFCKGEENKGLKK